MSRDQLVEAVRALVTGQPAEQLGSHIRRYHALRDALHAHDEDQRASVGPTVHASTNDEVQPLPIEMRLGDRLFEQFELGRWAGLEEALTAVKRSGVHPDGTLKNAEDKIRERLHLHFDAESRRRASTKSEGADHG